MALPWLTRVGSSARVTRKQPQAALNRHRLHTPKANQVHLPLPPSYKVYFQPTWLLTQGALNPDGGTEALDNVHIINISQFRYLNLTRPSRVLTFYSRPVGGYLPPKVPPPAHPEGVVVRPNHSTTAPSTHTHTSSISYIYNYTTFPKNKTCTGLSTTITAINWN